MFFTPIKSENDLQEERLKRLIAVEEYFKKHLEGTNMSLREKERNVTDLNLCFTMRRDSSPSIAFVVGINGGGDIFGSCYRNLYKHDISHLDQFYVFHATEEKELQREMKVLNFLLGNF